MRNDGTATQAGATDAFAAFLRSLETIDWTNSKQAHGATEEVLHGLAASPATLSRESALWQPETTRIAISRETSTHYKWFVHEDPAGRFVLWLHQYKRGDRRGDRHAVIPHNHRYWFSSLVLRGGFVSQDYERRCDGSVVDRAGQLRLSENDVFTIAPDVVHALEEIQDGTLTLVVQGRPVRSYSEAYDQDSATGRRFYDMDALLPALQRELAQLGGP